MDILRRGYQSAGHTSHVCVGYKRSELSDVVELNNLADLFGQVIRFLPLKNLRRRLIRSRKGSRLLKLLGMVSYTPRLYDLLRGSEGFQYPGIWREMKAWQQAPDLVHCHNLHNYYFDLRALPAMSHARPTVITLHDAWMLSGHCVHSMECERWQTGCGACPDLRRSYPIMRDRTALNYKEKGLIYKQSKLFVATPSQWLMDKVHKSMLAHAVVESRVINNGVDQQVFYPDDKTKAKQLLGLPTNKKVVLFASNGLRSNPWKDFKTLEKALDLVGKRCVASVLCIALGEAGDTQYYGDLELRFIPPVPHGEKVAQYYRASDVFLHPTTADTFPSVVLEALSCGTPVIATKVGGVPEQIIDRDDLSASQTGKKPTGFLVQQGEAKAWASKIGHLVTNEPLCLEMGKNAADDAKKRFSSDRMVKEYLDWFSEIQARHAEGKELQADC